VSGEQEAEGRKQKAEGMRGREAASEGSQMWRIVNREQMSGLPLGGMSVRSTQ
jgi:hypothetical protein